MIGQVTTLSTLKPQPVDSNIELLASEVYLINTNNNLDVKLEGTTDSLITYTTNKHEDRALQFKFTVTETNAQVKALADVAVDSNVVILPVFPNAVSPADIANDTAENWYFNVDQIVFAANDSTDAYARVLFEYGGMHTKWYWVNYNIQQILDEITTGTTSTTTTSTSTTSTSSTTSTTSTTSTSSTSTTSTSSTSTSSTSTTSTTTIA